MLWRWCMNTYMWYEFHVTYIMYIKVYCINGKLCSRRHHRCLGVLLTQLFIFPSSSSSFHCIFSIFLHSFHFIHFILVSVGWLEQPTRCGICFDFLMPWTQWILTHWISKCSCEICLPPNEIQEDCVGLGVHARANATLRKHFYWK